MTDLSLRDALEKYATRLEQLAAQPSGSDPRAVVAAAARDLRELLAAHPAEPVGVSDEAVEALTDALISHLDTYGVPWHVKKAILRDVQPFMQTAPQVVASRPSLETVTEYLAAHMADSWMGDEVDCADVALILAPAVLALMGGAETEARG